MTAAHFFRALGIVVLIASCMTGTARAQNEGNVSVGAGIDLVSNYYFRGIVQETSGAIAQPWLEAGIGFANGISLAAGTWNSLHSKQKSGVTVPSWYESDFYAGLSFGANAWSTDVTYTKYMSPRGSWASVKEVAIGVGYDTFVAPYVIVAIEMNSVGGADRGNNDGTYFELGVEPGVSLNAEAVSVSIPIAVGLSLNNYYEGGGNDNSFGFFSAGASLGIPLDSIRAEYGSWEFTGNVSLLIFGDGLKAINSSSHIAELNATVGLSMGY